MWWDRAFNLSMHHFTIGMQYFQAYENMELPDELSTLVLLSESSNPDIQSRTTVWSFNEHRMATGFPGPHWAMP